MSNIVQNVLDKLAPIFTTTDEVLTEWSAGKAEGNLQFPVLLGMIAVKLNWDEKQLRENDPLVRFYVRNNPEWYVTRGAHGGIMRSTDKQSKEAAKVAKDLIKAQLKSAINAKTDAKSDNATTTVDTGDVSDSE